MKSRLETYLSKRWKQKLKYTLLSSVVILPSLYFTSGVLSSNPGTFAWFSSETSADGSIQNATTSDLLGITAGKVMYEKNGKVSVNVTITNISQFDTTVSVGFGSYSVSKRLKPGKSFVTNWNDIDNFQHNGNATSIQFPIKAFINYVDETISVAIDQNKLKATTSKEENNPNPTKTETQSNRGPQENQNNTSETTANDQNKADETTANDKNSANGTTTNDQNNAGTTQIDENSGNPTPADTTLPNQNEETPIESKGDAKM